jgi:hypothetical protein
MVNFAYYISAISSNREDRKSLTFRFCQFQSIAVEEIRRSARKHAQELLIIFKPG